MAVYVYSLYFLSGYCVHKVEYLLYIINLRLKKILSFNILSTRFLYDSISKNFI